MDQQELPRRSSQHGRPSLLVHQPTYRFTAEDTTTPTTTTTTPSFRRRKQQGPGDRNNPWNNPEWSSYDDSCYSDFYDDENDGDDEDARSFASDSDDGILSPEEIDKQEKRIIAVKEHKRVFRARIFVMLLLMITAISNALIVYFLTRNKENDDYVFHYKELANEIMQVTKENARVAFVSLDAMSKSLTNYVVNDPVSEWPYATFPNFPCLAESVRNVSGAIQVVYSPIVDENQRLAWERYSVEHQQWLTSEEHIEYYRARRRRRLVERIHTITSTSEAKTITERTQQQSSHQAAAFSFSSPSKPRYPLPQSFRSSNESSNNALLQSPQKPQPNARRRQLHADHNFRGVIPGRIHPAPTREERWTPGMQYAPVWQTSPTPYYRGIVNYDLYREPTFQQLSQIVHATGQAVLSNQLNDDLVALMLEEFNAQDNPLSAYYHPPADDHTHGKKYPPTSVMVQPVWNDLAMNRTVAGYLIALIPWEAYLLHTFRPDSEEAALARYEEAQCQSETPLLNYKLQGGEEVQFLGAGEDFPGRSSFDFSMSSSLDFPLQLPTMHPESSLLANTTKSKEENDDVASTTTAHEGGSSSSSDEWVPEDCIVELLLYPSDELRALYITNWPIYYALLVITVFFILWLAFFVYDCLVERRRGRAMAVAEKTGRIVTSLFPSHFADQIIAEDKQKEKDAKKNKKKKNKKKKVVIEEAPTRQLKKYMASTPNGNVRGMDGSGRNHDLGYGDARPDGEGETALFLSQSKPIADLFPETTVLFADIAGFTAWSSVREPSQVFTLLETVYQNFDFLAKQYGIFKIETIGDCYVAVCGLPEPRSDHAVAMSRFAQACMNKMKVLVSQLEVNLGPDTGDLTMRFGLHSGPVTAGVLRGERARFQLFGDTVNTSARMESTGLRDKIQISQETADLLVVAGKSHWFTKRDGLVKAKGKGELQTYWLQSNITSKRQSMGHNTITEGGRRRHSMGGTSMGGHGRASGNRDGMGESASTAGPRRESSFTPRQMPSHNSDRLVGLQASSRGAAFQSHVTPKPPVKGELSKKQQRLVDWNVEMLQQLIRQIVARRNFLRNASKPIHLPFTAMMSELPKIGGMMIQQGTSSMPLDEVVEVINLPEFDVAAYHGNTDAKHIRLNPAVVTELRQFVLLLASRYRDNPFHNFEHASHVAMSVSKLLTRIVAPDLASINERHDNNDLSTSLHLTNDMRDLHDHTYGITSDPLTQLAVVMSALIHDVDHRGVPNNILAKEEPAMAEKYRNKSVAEQNSVDMAWEVFMEDGFKALRETICPEYTELRRFRQIIVNSVLATDIFDPELSTLRKARWAKAFPPVGQTEIPAMPFAHRRASFNVGMSNMNANNNNRRNMRATIVIEHLIQASDVSHTMQHWHIYQKWNYCLFREMYTAYKEGRADKDPSEGWYKGEIWFFDNYVIPLAKKLKECGVFGVSSDEYLDYATANRNEWEEKGEGIVAQMLAKHKDVVDKASLGYE